MTNDELRELVDGLGRLHQSLPTTNPNKQSLWRQYVLDAIKELTLFQLREQQVSQDVKELSELRASSKTMKALIADLNQKLSGRPETESTVAAQAIGRGVDQNELREG